MLTKVGVVGLSRNSLKQTKSYLEFLTKSCISNKISNVKIANCKNIGNNVQALLLIQSSFYYRITKVRSY